MVASFVVAAREGLEASLILAILSAYLTKTANAGKMRALWLGAAGAVLASFLLAGAVFIVAGELSGRAQEAFEGFSMAFAAAVLSYMILWMRRQSRNMKHELESRIRAALQVGSYGALATVAFIAVFREGAETVLYLLAGSEGTSAGPAVAGTGLGLAVAAGLGYLVFQGSHRLNLRLFFDITGVVLLVFAAGLAGRAAAALQVAGLFPGTISAWDTRWLLDDQSFLGGIASGLLGYSASPSLLQVMFYAAYIAVVGHLYLEEGNPTARRRQEPFVPMGSGYEHRLYRVLRDGRLTTALPGLALAAMAGLLTVALLPIDVGPFRNEGPLSLGPFIGPENGDNLFNLVLWVVWLPLLSLSALAFGRIWCGNVCPVRLVSDAGRSLGDWLTGRSSPTSPYLRMGWVLPVSFILITYFVKSWPIQSEARLGAYMFLTIFALAFLVGAVFRRGTWCRYICPVGGWLARIARLSAVAVRPNADVCGGCVDKPCLTGPAAGRCPSYLNPSRLDSSRYCLDCWVCLRNCPAERASMKVGWRLPGAELARPTAPDLWESIFIAALFGMYVAVGHRWVGLAQAPWPLVFFGFIGLAGALFVVLCAVVGALRAVPFREALATFGYIFLPLEFAVAVLTFGDDALEFFDIVVPAAGVLLTIGFAWSALLAASILRYRAPNSGAALRAAIPVGVALVALAFLWLGWYASGTVVDLT